MAGVLTLPCHTSQTLSHREASSLLGAAAAPGGRLVEAPADLREVHGWGSFCGAVQPQIPGRG